LTVNTPFQLRLVQVSSDPLPGPSGPVAEPAGQEIEVRDLSVEPVDYDALLQRILAADSVQVW